MDALINVNGDQVQTLEILFLTTLITLLPSIVVMMTSFTRYIIAFSFLRTAMSLQQNPPNMVLIGMALFLTLFTMSPVVDTIRTEAYEPYVAEEITRRFGTKDIRINYVGPVIGNHSGPGTLALFFLGTPR